MADCHLMALQQQQAGVIDDLSPVLLKKPQTKPMDCVSKDKSPHRTEMRRTEAPICCGRLVLDYHAALCLAALFDDR